MSSHPDRVLATFVNADTDEWFFVADEPAYVVPGEAVMADQCGRCGQTAWVIEPGRGSFGVSHDPEANETGCDAFYPIEWRDADDVIF